MMPVPTVTHPDTPRLLARPKYASTRSRRNCRPGDSASTSLPPDLADWRIDFEQQMRNLEHRMLKCKRQSQDFDFSRENTVSTLRENTVNSATSFQSWGSIAEHEMLAEFVATVVRREVNIMRNCVLEKNADLNIWLESAFSEMKALQLRVLDDVQDLRVTQKDNQESGCTTTFSGIARSEPAPSESNMKTSRYIPVAAQCIDNEQELGASDVDGEVDEPIKGLDKDKTHAFNRCARAVSSDLRSKKRAPAVVELIHDEQQRIQESQVHHYVVDKLTPYVSPKPHIPHEPPKDGLATFVRGGVYEGVVGLAVILNAFFIGIDVNDSMHRAVTNEGTTQDAHFEWINIGFTIFFTMEVILTMIGLRAWFIFGSDKGWNIFNTILAAISLFDLALGEKPTNLFFVRLLKNIRMARVLRVVRLLRFFQELRRMVMSILASLQALTWALILLMLMMYVFSIVLMHAGVNYLSESGTSADQILWKQFYGSIAISMYGLIQSISGGQDWERMVEPLESLAGVYQGMFVFFILFIVFGLLNVLTGVFIGSAAEIMDRDFVIQAEMLKERQYVQDMKELVRKLDDDKSPKITWHRFCRLTENPEMKAFLAADGLHIGDVRLLFSLCAGSMDAMDLGAADFGTACHRLKGPANQLQVETLMIELEMVHSLLHANFTKVLKYLRAAEYANRVKYPNAAGTKAEKSAVRDSKWDLPQTLQDWDQTVAESVM